MSKKKCIVFFTKFTADDEISRNRFCTIETALQGEGFTVVYCPLYSANASEEYYKKGTEPSGFSDFIARMRRRFQMLLNKENTIAVIEYPLLPGTSFSLYQKWLTKQKKVVIDITSSEAKQDSVFKEILPLADTVITTTPALTRQLLSLSKELIEIPFSVATKEYETVKPIQYSTEERQPFRIGWIGNEKTSQHFLLLKDCFLQLHDLYNIQLQLIGFDKTRETELKDLPFVNQARNEETDISTLKACDVGVLPLPDDFNDFPFQMIQYMACHLPVVVSSNEVTIAINRRNDNLFAKSTFEWYSCLAAMIQNKDFYKEAGRKNQMIANDFYSVDKTQKDYLTLLLTINVD